MRAISFALTTPQFLDGSKTVTRRMGWATLGHGDLLQACRKCMGLKKGAKRQKLGVIRVVTVRRERLGDVTPEDVKREGFRYWAPPKFIEFFCQSHSGCTPDTIVTRIEFERVEMPK